MSRITTRLATVVVALGVTSLWLLLAPPSEGASATAAGWWSNAGQSPVPLDLSATGLQPGPGQLGVAASPGGAAAVAAVRFTLDPGEEPSALTVQIVSGQGQEVAVVIACPAASSWSPASPGPLADAPKAACDTRLAAAKPASDGSLRFALDPAFVTTEGVLDLVIAPGTTDVGGAPITPPFNFVLATPTAADLATLQTGDPFSAPDAGFTPAADAFTATTTPSSGAFEPTPTGSSDVPAGTGGGFLPEPAPDAPAAFTDPVQPAPGVALGVPRRAVAVDDDDRAQRFGMILFPIAVLGAIWALNASTPGLRGIGRLAHPVPVGAGEGEGPTEAGLSRFRRERTAPPVPLR